MQKMIYILDKEEYFSVNGVGHFGLQYKWMKILLKDRNFKEISYGIKNIKVFLYLLLTQKNRKIFFPNMSLFDRNSIFYTLLSFISPLSRKIIIVHTINKYRFINYIFFRFSKNTKYYVYSEALRSYIHKLLPKNSSNVVLLAEFPNARMMKSINLSNNEHNFSDLYAKEGLSCVIWGHSVFKIDQKKISKLIIEENLKKIILIGNHDVLNEIKYKYPDKIDILEYASDKDLATILSQVDFNMMVLKDDHNFYAKKHAASGVYLTSLMFRLPSLIWMDMELHKEEILQDGASIFFDGDHQQLINFLKIKRKSNDPYKRDSINLDFNF